jgi:hypothetical protein
MLNINYEKWAKKYAETWLKETKKYPIIYRDDKTGKNLKETSPNFEHCSKVFQKRGYLLFDEFISICKWKTDRQAGRYVSDSNKKQIREITFKIITQHLEIEQNLDELEKLDGVGIPVASAILTVIFPMEYCILDYRAWRALNHRKNFKDYSEYSIFLDSYDHRSSIKSYKTYLEEIKKIAAQHPDMSPRKIEMALWKYDQSYGQDSS